MTGLQNKVVLVTGASSGIGAAVAVDFAKLGCKLSIVGRIAENLEKTAVNCIAAGCLKENIFQSIAELTNEEECEKIVEDTCKYFGKLDVLYNTLFPASVAKAALDQLTRALSLESGPKGVRVVSVNPGSVEDTAIWERSGICPTEEKLQAHHAKSRPMYPLQRLTNSAEVAGVVTWLASDDASFIHGVILPVDGGITCMSQYMM
ncbi:hypothetical protein LSH36_318g00008 [Paralvinella palmiformis]|uniref:Uncharacterized protein n=1 Tax=Paralvinella palmiformis TaxID=53620 RepID=A0AAD9JI04_9ANNE|nr:hypothetical protein LSH36_318g00008 [Paralvinella palmiformis]